MDPQQGPPQQDLIIGQTIGNYLVTQKLGEGGMGAVYLAEHPSIGKKVALKVLHSEFSSNEDVVNRFFNEAKAVNNIGHPNIVDITDYGIIQVGVGRDHLVYFIMEYLGGMTLSKLIANESPLPPERALSIGLQIADALAASHKCGIVHRDLKPDNIMLLHRGREHDFVKLLDFGIAKLTGGAAGSRRTRTGIVMGTPAYMSPEQCDGRGNIDHRTDVYALGIVLYEMLVGRVPFLGEGYGEVLVQHLTQAPIPPSQFRMMNPHVEAVVMKALEKRAEFRYPTMDEMMRAMTDPVAFVEQHGGIGTFNQVQLMPSTAPIPSVRLTPSPISSGPMYPTPAPGMMTPQSMQMRAQHGHPGTNPPPGMHTPTPGAHAAPTALGEQPKKSKLGLLIVVMVAMVAGVIAMIVIMKKPDAPTVASGSDGSSGSEKVVAGSGSAKPVGSASGAPTGSGSAGSATVKEPGKDPGSGSAPGSAAPGSAAPVEKMVSVMITTKPAGARILINGQELSEKTGETFQLQRSGHEVRVTLQLDKYEDIVLTLKPEQTINLEKTFKKKSGGGTYVRPQGGSGSGTPGRGSGSGKKGSNDTGLMRPGD
jgi:serine/threonine protein kinase